MSAPLYTPGVGTIRVSGSGDCKKIAKCALHFINQRKMPVDFFFVGSNAGHQAIKAIGIVTEVMKDTTNEASSLVFEILHVSTQVQEPETKLIDATVLRAYVIRKEMLSSLRIQNSPASV